MSILSALKAKGANGKNIEEAVKTLPIGGGSGGGVLVVNGTVDGATITLDKTWKEMYDATVPMFISASVEGYKKMLPVVGVLNMAGYVVQAIDAGFNNVVLYEFGTIDANGYPSVTIDE